MVCFLFFVFVLLFVGFFVAWEALQEDLPRGKFFEAGHVPVEPMCSWASCWDPKELRKRRTLIKTCDGPDHIILIETI